VTRARDLVAQLARNLQQAGIPGAPGDARALVAAAMGVPRDRLTLHLDDPVNHDVTQILGALLHARVRGRPVSRILGQRMFFGRDFHLSDAVLDPRPETETLIIQSLPGKYSRFLDLGTGSGCILVTLLAERPQARGVGSDISPAALGTARHNLQRHGVADRGDLVVADWFAGIAGRFDLIVSNPPYIAAHEMAGLMTEVRDHDPRIALTDGADGLSAYRAIAAGAAAHLLPAGRLILEIGPTQGAAVADLCAQAGLSGVTVLPDLDGRDRVVAARLT